MDCRIRFKNLYKSPFTYSYYCIYTLENTSIFIDSTIMAAVTAVCDLKPFKSMWKSRVKIIRLWRSYVCGDSTLLVVV